MWFISVWLRSAEVFHIRNCSDRVHALQLYAFYGRDKTVGAQCVNAFIKGDLPAVTKSYKLPLRIKPVNHGIDLNTDPILCHPGFVDHHIVPMVESATRPF